jgi:hypothetical protein
MDDLKRSIITAAEVSFMKDADKADLVKALKQEMKI